MSQLPLLPEASISYAPEDFVVSDCNALAYQAVTQPLSQWQQHAILLNGAPASGLTHLCHVACDAHGGQFLTPSALNEPDSAAYFADTPLRVVDDCEQADPVALFHLLNYVRQSAEARLLLASHTRLKSLHAPLPDLHSRLCAVPHYVLAPLDETLLEALLRKGFADRQLRVDSSVIQFLLPRLERSYSSVQATLETLDAAAMREKRSITLPFIKDVLVL